jgi:lipoprotein NlpD
MIAEMGNSGTTEAKLRFEIRFKGKSLDPQQFLPKK